MNRNLPKLSCAVFVTKCSSAQKLKTPTFNAPLIQFKPVGFTIVRVAL